MCAFIPRLTNLDTGEFLPGPGAKPSVPLCLCGYSYSQRGRNLFSCFARGVKHMRQAGVFVD